jgi:hypothetical protein
MLQMPRRSVTRFFIPLIDVLVLLLSLFILLPLVKEVEDSKYDKGALNPTEAQQLRNELEELRKEVAKLRGEVSQTPEDLRKELERLRREKMQVLKDKLWIRILQIDDNTGALTYLDPDRVEVRNQADAVALIERDRRALGPGRELYYLILYPRDRNSSYPLQGQREQYERWFKDVALGFDIPGETARGGPKP